MISCNQHDYIEIACLFLYPIKLTMKNNTVIKCVALDTQYNETQQECIKVESDGVERLVILDHLSTMEACIDNPHFKTVNFN